MRISDWSSDVCSSDLRGIVARRELSWPLEAAAFLSCVYFGSSGWFAYTPADMSNPVAIGTILSTAAYFYFAVSPGSLTGRLLSGPTLAYLGTVSYSQIGRASCRKECVSNVKYRSAPCNKK